MAMCPGDTTQWDDIHRKMGNFDPKERVDDPHMRRQRNRTEKALIDVCEKLDPLEHCTAKDLIGMEDDADEDVLIKYRRARMAELKQAQSTAKFGGVKQVCKGDFIREVTDGSANGQWVVLLLYVDAEYNCHYLHAPWKECAARFPSVKFMTGIAAEVIPDFPDSHCPAVVIYKDTECQKQIIGLHEWGGSHASASTVEWVLSTLGVLETELEEDPRGSKDSSTWRRREHRDDDSDEEEANETVGTDRCYSSMRLGRRIGKDGY